MSILRKKYLKIKKFCYYSINFPQSIKKIKYYFWILEKNDIIFREQNSKLLND